MTAQSITHRGIRIERRLLGYARAKSGNADNPTPRYRYVSPYRFSVPLRAAKQIIDIALDEDLS